MGEEWKEGDRRPIRAIAQAVGDNGRDWLITIKNRSMTAEEVYQVMTGKSR